MKGEFLSLETARRLHNRRKKEYTLYKGEEILAFGTIDEIARQLNVKPRTIKFYLSPTYKKRGRGEKSNKRRILIES